MEPILLGIFLFRVAAKATAIYVKAQADEGASLYEDVQKASSESLREGTALMAATNLKDLGNWAVEGIKENPELLSEILKMLRPI